MNKSERKKKRIAWLIPGVGKGSGGHRTIIQNINALSKAGYICDLFVIGAPEKTVAETKKKIEKYFGEIQAAHIYITFDHIPSYDMVFATGWQTINDASNIINPNPAYFIQDYEPWFHPLSFERVFTKKSYNRGWHHITIGRWLAHKVSRPGNKAQFFDFCADLENYHPLPDVKKENAICLLYQPDKSRRFAPMVLDAAERIATVRPDLTIYLFGNKDKVKTNKKNIKSLGLISIKELNKLYNKCQLGLSISPTNPSRIPFEMMAAGLPVVELARRNNYYDLPRSAVSFAKMNSRAISRKILSLLDNDKRLEKMSASGIKYMKNKSLDYGYAQFVKAVDNIFTKPSYSKRIIRKVRSFRK